MTLIYKILTQPQWDAMREAKSLEGAPVDIADGFIHFSTADQLPETLAKHFARQDDLTILAVDAASLGDALKWEPSRGGALFPHLYRTLALSEVVWAKPAPLVDGAHQTPV